MKEQIRTAINNAGGMSAFPASVKNERPIGCPMKRMMKSELQGLTNEELHVAFHLGLIGNNNCRGSIVENAKH